MRRFDFPLEPVRALREQEELRATESLAAELDLHRQRADELDHLMTELERATTAQESPHATGRELMARQAFVERIERDRDTAREQVSQQSGEVDRARGTLASAASEHELVERLKRRRELEHERALRRFEDATMSEIALARHVRERGAQ